MIGIDTNILVAHVIPDHPFHGRVRDCIARLLAEGHGFALTSGIVSEFIHIVTDSRRFENPLTMTEALEWSAFWSDATEISLISSDVAIHQLWLRWLEQHRLGRKRLIDTLIAATWHTAGVRKILTLNPRDFTIFGAFTVVPIGEAE